MVLWSLAASLTSILLTSTSKHADKVLSDIDLLSDNETLTNLSSVHTFTGSWIGSFCAEFTTNRCFSEIPSLLNN